MDYVIIWKNKRIMLYTYYYQYSLNDIQSIVYICTDTCYYMYYLNCYELCNYMEK